MSDSIGIDLPLLADASRDLKGSDLSCSIGGDGVDLGDEGNDRDGDKDLVDKVLLGQKWGQLCKGDRTPSAIVS